LSETQPGPVSFAALRDAVLKGHEPPPVQFFARRASYPWFVVGVVCIGAFMGQVDASMTQMLLPRLEHEFNAQLSTVSWIAVGYLLAMASFMPIFGRLADMLGRKLLYTTGFLLFVVGSGLCGFAPNLPVLIAFRILQAVGAALITANSIAIVVLATSPDKRGRALGLQSAFQAIGLGAGPALGGLILDMLGWHWAFWINVPFGIAGAILGWLIIPQTRNLPVDSHFDWKGAFLIAPALTAVVAVLNEGYSWGATSPVLLGCAALAIFLLTWFVRAERRAKSPLVDLRLFQISAFRYGNLANFMAYAALFGVFFLIPFTLVRVYHDSAFVSGLRLSIIPVMLGLLAPIGGALYDRYGARTTTASGMAICTAGLVLLYVFMDGTAAHLPMVMAGMALVGVGQGLFISPNSSAIMTAAPTELTGEAGSVLNVVRYLGISTGIAGGSAMLALAMGRLDGRTVDVPSHVLVMAGRDVILLLCCFSVLAGVLSLMRTTKPA
jgi:EmrB/QacA subfamily drug resistance transporter